MVARLFIYFIANFLALLAAGYFIPQFTVSLNPALLLSSALILTALNNLLKPILKFILTPFIIITFGLLNIGINMATLFLLDLISENIKINGLAALAEGALLLAAFNIIASIIIKWKH